MERRWDKMEAKLHLYIGGTVEAKLDSIASTPKVVCGVAALSSFASTVPPI